MGISYKKSLKKQKGQVVVVFAFVLVMIVCFLGLAIDTWIIIYNKQNLQNSVDLAALAAVQQVTNNHGQVESTAIEFVHKNEINHEGTSVKVNFPYKEDSNKVELIATKKVKFVFLPIIGLKGTEVTARAVAAVKYSTETSYTDRTLDYVVFSGSTAAPLIVKGNGSVVTGNVHANAKVDIQGTKHTINGNLTAASDIKTGTCTITGTVTQKGSVVPTPSFGFEELAAQAVQVFDGDIILNDINIDGIWLVNGNLTLNGGRITGRGVILARGSINMPSNNVEYATSNDLLALYSLGDITLSCTRNRIQGILYAPNGQIRISGSYNTFYGALIANEVYWVTKDITIDGTYDIRAPQAFTITKKTFNIEE